MYQCVALSDVSARRERRLDRTSHRSEELPTFLPEPTAQLHWYQRSQFANCGQELRRRASCLQARMASAFAIVSARIAPAGRETRHVSESDLVFCSAGTLEAFVCCMRHTTVHKRSRRKSFEKNKKQGLTTPVPLVRAGKSAGRPVSHFIPHGERVLFLRQ